MRREHWLFLLGAVMPGCFYQPSGTEVAASGTTQGTGASEVGSTIADSPTTFEFDASTSAGSTSNATSSASGASDFLSTSAVTFGTSSSSGDYSDSDMTETMTTAGKTNYCGDGFIQYSQGEECDDGNVLDNDWCTSSCQKAECGDGLVNIYKESCDDANQYDGDECTAACEFAFCGDGIVQVGVEECDDANFKDSDGCRTSCKKAACGDGVVYAGVEECDDANFEDLDNCGSGCKIVVHRKVFVYSVQQDGDMGGLVGADALCKSAASAAKLKNATLFKAWLHDGIKGPADRFDTAFSGVYELTDGAHVAKFGWVDLTDGDLHHSIDRDENNNAVTPVSVWTNLNSLGGKLAEDHCNGWTSGSTDYLGRLGVTSLADYHWTNNNQIYYCDKTRRIYYFEDE